jgi:hypothetical protein
VGALALEKSIGIAACETGFQQAGGSIASDESERMVLVQAMLLMFGVKQKNTKPHRIHFFQQQSPFLPSVVW